MTTETDFGYVQARMQARLPLLTPEAQWQRLGAVRSFSAYLEEARATPLRPRVMGFSARSSSHEIERQLRAQWRQAVAEVAGWAPTAWRPSVAWVVWLVDLPLLREALSAGLPVWARSDDRWGGWVREGAGLDLDAARRSGAQPLLRAGVERLADAWLGHWVALWPAMPASWRRPLDRGVALIRQLWVWERTSAAVADREAHCSARLRCFFHCHSKQPVSLFVYLALVALELGRLLGALSQRALFAAQEEIG